MASSQLAEVAGVHRVMTISAENPDDDDAFAAEYVLGLLDYAERVAAEQRMKDDSQFAAMVLVWIDRFGDLNNEYVPVPAPNVLPAIERRLFPEVKQRRNWFAWLVPTAAVASLASLLVAALLIFTGSSTEPTVVTLAAEGSATRFEARILDLSLVVARVQGNAAEADTVFELWAIEAGQNPRSLGTFSDEALTVPFDLADGEVTLAVSLEPTGGSPTGLPTGPVLATGTVSIP